MNRPKLHTVNDAQKAYDRGYAAAGTGVAVNPFKDAQLGKQIAWARGFADGMLDRHPSPGFDPCAVRP